MTVSAMHTMMGDILQDPDEDRYDEDIKNEALNDAQIQFATVLPSDFVRELQAEKTGISITSSGYSLTLIASSPGPMLPGRNVELYISSLSLWGRYIEIDKLKERSNHAAALVGGVDANPLFWIWGDTLHAEVTTDPVTANLYYIRRPKQLVKSSPSGYQATTCELDVARHDWVVELASALCFKWDGDWNDAKIHYDRLDAELDRLMKIYGYEKEVKLER